MKLYFFPALVPVTMFAPGIIAVAGMIFAAMIKLKRNWQLAVAAFAAFIAIGFAAVGLFRPGAMPALPALEQPEQLPAQIRGGNWVQYLPRAPLSDLALSTRHHLLLFGTRQGSIDALSTDDGTLRFSVPLSAPVLAKPLITEDRAFIGEGLHETPVARVTALELPGGRPLWTRSFKGHIEAAPAYAADQRRLFGCAGDDGVFSLAADTGASLWKAQLGHCDMTPLVSGPTVFALVGAVDKRSFLVAMDRESGAEEWRIELPGQPWGALALAGDHLLTGTGLGQVNFHVAPDEAGWAHSINLRTRRLEWTRLLGGMPLLGVALLEHQGLAVYALKKGVILAIDIATGKPRWTHQLPSPTLSMPRVIPDGSAIATLAFDGTLRMLDSRNGRELHSRRIGQESTSAPVLLEKTGYFATRGELWALPLDLKEAAGCR